METIKVRTKWQGKVSIRSNQLDRIFESKQDFVIECEGEQMTIQFSKLAESIVAKSKEKFFDKFSKEFHQLYYFKWKTDPQKQKTLL